MKSMKPFVRITALFGVVMLAVMAISSGVKAQLAPEVRPHVTVNDEFVRLSDLFVNPGEAGETAVFRAPAPGGSGTVQASRLVRVAAEHGIEWNNPRGIREIQVTRSGLLIPKEDVQELIARTLDEKLNVSVAGRTFEISFAADYAPLYVSSDKEPSAEVAQLRFNRRSGQFTVAVTAPAGDPTARRHVYTGNAVVVQAVPVVIHTVRRGSVIAEQDVEIRNIPVARIDNSTMTEQEDLVGMAAKRTLREGAPVKARDIERPKVVRKNHRVTVHHKVPGLVLSARAIALQSGALGDIINIRNTTSNRIIQGRVVGPELVEAIVGGPNQVAQANQ